MIRWNWLIIVARLLGPVVFRLVISSVCENTYVIFSALYYPNIGGVENFTRSISKQLVRMGHRVIVVTSSGTDMSGEEDDGLITVFLFQSIMLLNGRLPFPLPSHRYFALWRSLLNINCDGVLVNTRFYPHSILGLHYARKKGITPILLEHGSAYLTLGSRPLDAILHAYENAITRIVKSYGCLYYGVSKSCCEWLNHFDISAQGVIPNAINIDEFRSISSGLNIRASLSIDDSTEILLFVGRLVPEKGIDSLISAASHLCDIDVKIVVVGDGPLRSSLEASAPDNVAFVGALTREDVSAILSQSNIVCLPSRSEGFATVLLEASAWGVPACVTRVGGASEIILDNEYGWLLDSADTGVLVRTLRLALSDKDVLISQGKKAKALVEHRYTWTGSAESLVQAFRLAAQSNSVTD